MLNHLLVADFIWLKRIDAASGGRHELAFLSEIPMPASLNLANGDKVARSIKRE